MELKTTEQRYREYLDTLPLSTLRILGRANGVGNASSNHKNALIETIVQILTGKAKPAPRSNRGAPAKQSYVDPVILERLAEIRRAGESERHERDRLLEVAAGEPYPALFDAPVFTGILEITQAGYGFVRIHNCQPSSSGGDVFLAAPTIQAYGLREGDYIACTAKPRQKNDAAAIDTLLSVNGCPVGRYEHRPWFDSLTAQYPCQKIALSDGNTGLSLRMLDLFAPIGKGQRALIIAPPKAGKTTLLKETAQAIASRHRDLKLILLLIDERPEEVTDLRTNIKDADIFYSTFDEGAEHHVRAATLTIAYAKRMAELGSDIVILLDSLTKLTRAYNYIAESTGKTLSGGLAAGALTEPKRFFGAARNTKEAGSITILATVLVETGSRMDDVIYEEFKGTGNADIFLSRELAERRIFPAIDLRRSGTRKEELLLTDEELDCVYKLRERGLVANVPGVIDMLRRTQDNAEFIARLPEWLRVYKNN